MPSKSCVAVQGIGLGAVGCRLRVLSGLLFRFHCFVACVCFESTAAVSLKSSTATAAAEAAEAGAMFYFSVAGL